MPEIKKYKNTGLEYVESTARFMFRQKGEREGIVITRQEFIDWDKENSLFSRLLAVKPDEGRGGFDFEYAAETGNARGLDGKPRKLKKTPLEAESPMANRLAVPDGHFRSMHDMPDKPGFEKALDVRNQSYFYKALDEDAEQVATAQPTKQKKKGLLADMHTSRNVMIVVMLVVGACSLMLSAYHIVAYLWEARGPLVALVSGGAMALFSASAFTTGRYFFSLAKKSQQLKNTAVALAFWVFGVAIVVYAMFATMDVNFNDFKKRQDAKVVVAVNTDVTVKSASQKDADTRAEMARLDDILKKADNEEAPWNAEVNRLTRSLLAPDLTEEQITAIKAARSNAQYNYNVIENRVKADRKKRGELSDKLTGTGDAAVSAETAVKQAAEKGTFFGLLNDLFGWDIETMKLIVYVIPAVFYDLMSPFALTIVLILEEKREKEDEEVEPE